jgi:alpha-galactosidase
MTHRLENSHLQLVINPEISRWSLTGSHSNSPSIENAKTEFHYRRGRRDVIALNRWSEIGIERSDLDFSSHGPLRQLLITSKHPEGGLQFSLTFALPEDHPFLFWKMDVTNHGRRPILVNRLELISVGFFSQNLAEPLGSVHLLPLSQVKRHIDSPVPGEVAFFSNGWQSWSYTGVYRQNDRYRHPRLGPIRAPVIANPETPRSSRAGLFGSDMFAIFGHTGQRTGILAGFLSQLNHFGSIEAWIGPHPPGLRMWANGDNVRLDVGQEMSTDWACLSFFHLDTPDPLGPYVEAVARQHNLANPGRQDFNSSKFEANNFPENNQYSEIPSSHNPEKQPTIPTGWCSWYHFFQDVSADDIRQNLAAAAHLKPDLPLEVFQIDDGYETCWGDWSIFKDTFPQGVSPLAGEIRSAGFTPGLWLAPFIVQPQSRLMAEHPDWILRGRFNRPVNAGYFWGAFTTALDLTNPDALDHTAQTIHRAVHEWGFPYLKLDFLYAGALPGRRQDATQTRAQVLRHALQTLRQAAGDRTTLLACGCPLGSAIGLVDIMRISSDVDTHWLPVHHGVKMGKFGDDGKPSARNAIHNTLTRAPLHLRWWINDPDCLLLRRDMELTEAEVQSLATVIAMSGGSLLLSDHLPNLPPERLHLAQSLLPPIGKRPTVLDWFDRQTPSRLQVDMHGPDGRWHLLALFNWSDKTQDIGLSLHDFNLDTRTIYYAREFWGGACYTIRPGSSRADPILLEKVAANGVALLAVRPHQSYRPQYLGSDLHISQGMELTAWETSQTDLHMRLNRPGRAKGLVELGLPHPPAQAWLNDQPITWFPHGDRCYRLDVEFDQTAEIVIKFLSDT